MRTLVVRRLTSCVLVAAAAALVAIPATSAKDGDVLVRGTCTKASSSKLKLIPEDGRIEVEFEVDQNRNGVRWTVSLRRPTRVVFRGTRSTRAPSGSFELRRVVGDTAGSDRLTARATSPSGEVCRATATFS
jgi:2-methylaconitate cis-trans-isomerase PrpF